MCKYIITAFLFLSLSVNSFTQNEYAAIINYRAKLYAKALKKHDFKSVVSLTYPKYIQLIHRDTLLSQVSNDMVKMKKEGLRYKSIFYKEPKPLLSSDDVLYCIVPQKIIKFNSQGEFRIETFMFAISNNLGKEWYFLNIKQFTLYQKELFPLLNDKIIIPKVSSKFIRNKKFSSFNKPN